MATIKYLLQSTSTNVNIYIRFSLNRETVIKRKTGFTINPKDWNKIKGLPNQKSEQSKIIKNKLDKLSIHIEDSYNNEFNQSIINGDWLQQKIDIFNNKTEIVELDILANYIQKYIDDAPNKKNQKNELGLGERRVKGLITFKGLFNRFETETNKNKKYLIKDVNIPFAEKFIKWLNNNGYSTNYTGKNIDNLKTICIDAEKNGIEVSSQLKAIKGFAEKKEPDAIIYLSDEEQEKIYQTEFDKESLKNAKKWLLFGCLIGQRVSDLLLITEKNIKEYHGNKIIELKQQKTGKLVAIPLLPRALELIKNGLPYKISDTKFNVYIKEVCKEAEINEIVKGRVKIEANSATKIIKAPKHKLISSHVCRRSFATNYYGKIPTPILINITGHATEKMFLNYIGKSSYDNALQMLDYFDKLNKIT
jgi:integrase